MARRFKDVAEVLESIFADTDSDDANLDLGSDVDNVEDKEDGTDLEESSDFCSCCVFSI